MPTISLSTGGQFSSADGQSLLDAGTQADVVLPYSCKIGRCSSCKCKVLSGKTYTLHDELGLSAREKAAGWVLSCVRSATTDIYLEVEDFGSTILPSVKKLPCRIHRLEKLAVDVLRVVLRIPPTQGFDFFPGQYIEVLKQGGARRSYSLANSSAANSLLELHIRFIPKGIMSEYWFSCAKLNDLLWLNGPLGTFFLRNVAQRDLVFLATGTGFAPVKSMLESLGHFSAQQMPRSVNVFWGGRTPEDLYWDLSSLAGTYNYVPVLSRANNNWDGVRGYVQNALIRKSLNLDKAVVFACGSEAMIDSARQLLNAKGLPEHRFFSDAFVCSSSSLLSFEA
tara:strand:+ start:7042 stop:8055 length:1014 start_codon:yes stop_codon:yes gene_type:complete